MIAVRWGMLLLAAGVVLALLGATFGHQQPSALRVLVTAVVGLLAPLFWPGNGETPMRTALRIVVWSAAAAGLAAIALRLLGSAAQPFSRILVSCGLLVPILLVTHAMVAVLEGRYRGPSRRDTGAHQPRHRDQSP